MKFRAIAFYLPQFHPVPENDLWWGKGFTEWTNTAKAKPLFRGHYQPHVPADLGFYDLRLAETRQTQAELASCYGIEAFCYYHYWFAGRRILERPFNEVLHSGQPQFPFCLCWANESWTGVWHGAPNKILIEQTYPGEADHRAHFAALLPAFRDPRYVRVNGKPLFVIYRPDALPAPRESLGLWRDLAAEAGLGSLYLLGIATNPKQWQPADLGLDAKIINLPRIMARFNVSKRTPLLWLRTRSQEIRRLPTIHRYSDLVREASPTAALPADVHPSLIHAWDNTPRCGPAGIVFRDARPEVFRALLSATASAIAGRPPQERLVFLKSWNEWAEGNHLEPDLVSGHGYLQAIRAELNQEAVLAEAEARTSFGGDAARATADAGG